nr:TonB-dependent receptor [Limnobacter humi]
MTTSCTVGAALIPTAMNKTLIALACAAACNSAWSEQASQPIELAASNSRDLPAVTVESSRLIDNKTDAPPSATLITQEDIRNSGYTSIAEVVQKLGFVNTRPGLVGQRDATFDLRGFGGSDAYTNVAIIVDGIRYSEKELATARISSIPVSSIEKIEIVRGGASVAYGDGASGGVIRITTTQPKGDMPLSGNASVSVGSYSTLETTVGLRGGANGFGLSVDATKSDTNGYRAQSAEDFGSAAATLTWSGQSIYTGVRVGTEGSDAQLSGALSPAEFKQNPRQAVPTVSNQGDYSFFKRDVVSAFLRTKGLDMDYGLDVSHREQRRSFKNGNPTGQRETVQDQISGFVSDSAVLHGMNHLWTVGVSSERADLDAKSQFSFGNFAARGLQSSYAAYVTDDVTVNDTLRVNAGYRLERFNQYRYDTGPFAPTEQSTQRNLNLEAVELGFSKVLTDDYTAFGKINRGYRVPNIDENDPASRPPSNTFLNPQRSKEVEVGARRRVGQQEQVVRLFKIWLDDEIANVNFSNVNLDKTQRHGIELEHQAPLFDQTSLRAAYTYTDSEFRSGNLAGTRVPLVPAHRVLLSVNQTLTQKLNAELLLQAQSDQRLGGDVGGPQENGKVPGYAVADFNLRYQLDKVKLVFSVNNLFDRDYYSQGYYNAFAVFSGRDPVGVYPDFGRNVRLTAQFDF